MSTYVPALYWHWGYKAEHPAEGTKLYRPSHRRINVFGQRLLILQVAVLMVPSVRFSVNRVMLILL